MEQGLTQLEVRRTVVGWSNIAQPVSTGGNIGIPAQARPNDLRLGSDDTAEQTDEKQKGAQKLHGKVIVLQMVGTRKEKAPTETAAVT